MKATELLKQQHREVEQLFERIEGGEEPIQELMEELADNLCAHAVIEEQLFYPTVKRSVDEDGVDLVLESFEEHALMKVALQRALATGIDEEPFKARVMTLKELVLNHVEEEEEELFPDVEKTINDETLSALAVQMKELFESSLEKGHNAILGPPAKIGIPQPPPSQRPRAASTPPPPETPARPNGVTGPHAHR